MKEVLLYIHQLPQNLVGLALRAYYKGTDSEYEGVIVRKSSKMQGGISLGKYIIVKRRASKKTIMHEYGHCRQSKYLGWFYLLVIGIQSGLHYLLCKCKNHNYDDMWFEAWANKLGGVKKE